MASMTRQSSENVSGFVFIREGLPWEEWHKTVPVWKRAHPGAIPFWGHQRWSAVTPEDSCPEEGLLGARPHRGQVCATGVGSHKVPSVTRSACLGLGSFPGARVCCAGAYLGLLPSARSCLGKKIHVARRWVKMECHNEGRLGPALLGQPCPEPLSLTRLHTPGSLTCPTLARLPALSVSTRTPHKQSCVLHSSLAWVCPAPADLQQRPTCGTFGNPVDSCGPSRCKEDQ